MWRALQRHARLTTAAVVVGVGVIAGGVAVLRLGPVTPDSAPSLYWRREGARVYGAMASRPIQEPGAIRAVLDAAEVVDAGGLLDRAPERLEDLRAAVSAFLEARFDAAHAQDYSRRVGLLGYRFIDPDEFVRRYGDAQRIADRFAAGTVERGALYSALWDNPEVRTATPTRL